MVFILLNYRELCLCCNFKCKYIVMIFIVCSTLTPLYFCLLLCSFVCCDLLYYHCYRLSTRLQYNNNNNDDDDDHYHHSVFLCFSE
jgi:hypothetical protein